MATPYLIIRLVPDAPVDGATFSTYLDDLHIDVYQANTTPPLTKLLGQTPWNAAPVILAPNPGTNQYVGTSSRPTTENTPYIGDQNYGNTLTFKNTDGIAVNSSLFSPSGSNFFSSKALTVKSVDGTTVTLDGGNIENFIPKGTVCAFMTDYTKWTYDSVAASMSNNHILVTKAKNGDSTLTLDGSGLFFGMAVSGPGIDADTTVLAADTGSVTLSKPITSDLVNTNITFSFSLPADIAQEFDLITTFSILGWPFKTAYIPASVATAIIPLTNLLSPPNMLNISINAYRKLGTGNQTIPVNHDFYNVPYYTDNPPVLSQFQYISDNEIALYITLPPPPSANVVPLALPNDGTPPNFDALYAAMTQTFASDNAFPLGSSLETLTSSDCKRMAYDIVWSQQGNTLPLPPDPLDSLYTNPPNPGGSGGNGNTNNLEQDRQKFEGTISSFYSTHNATAERLTKFVAAASAALFCEKTSLNSKTALIEFPVDPDPTVTFATAVEKELLLNGVGGTSSGLSFGVPAAFFYAIGASLDKSSTPAQRFKLATGDSIERLFQIFSAAEEANSISDKESFKTIGASAKTTLDCALGTNVLSFADTNGIQDNMSVAGLYIDSNTTVQSFTATTVTLSKPVLGDVAIGSIITFLSPAISVPTATAFQAARRLAALGISAASNSPSATIYPGTPLAQLISNWLAQTDPTPFPPPNPPLSYQHTDFNIWQLTLASADPQGYLYLDLDALTQGYSIPAFTLTPTGAPSPTTLTFNALNPDGSPLGIGFGMTVSGTHIAPNTTVTALSISGTTLTVTISPAALGNVTSVEFNTPGTSTPPSTLADQIFAWLPSVASPPTPKPTIDTLKHVTVPQWTSFFTTIGNASWLPPFTQPVAPGATPSPAAHKPGYTALRIRAFIRAVQQFFSISTLATTASLPTISPLPVFDLPAAANDPIAEAVGQLSTLLVSTFTFGTPITPANLSLAVQAVFPNDTDAQAWLSQTLIAINELTEIASVVPATGATLPNPVSLPYSVTEALYARGFRSASDISALTDTDFQQALIGTVAYAYASLLQAKAQQLAPQSPPTDSSGNGSFQPINPDGSLVNCVPPPCLAPTGAIAYLQELLKLTQSSTCENPFATALEGQLTLGNAIATRRGLLGNLLASCANLETPLPLIDIVNESLEYLGTAPATVSGFVYDTSADSLAGYPLCNDEQCKNPEMACHEPDILYAALPEYSTPATPVTQNKTVEPLVYNNLKIDFSACNLPYSQALDVSRTYLNHLGSSRFEQLRAFRKCITEFALAPNTPPTGFQTHLWRYPVRIDIGIEYLGITPEEYNLLFQGSQPQPCGPQIGDFQQPSSGENLVGQVFGFTGLQEREFSASGLIPLADFLSVTCLSYCELLDLLHCGFPLSLVSRHGDGNIRITPPACEPCCLTDYQLQLHSDNRTNLLEQLIIFIRLWKKLSTLCGARYTFVELYDICTAFQLFTGTGINPEFIRQLVAFQMLRDQFHLPLKDEKDPTPNLTGADRTHLLALWVGSSAKKWTWAKHHLLEGLKRHARLRFQCLHEEQEKLAHIGDQLDALSRLVGFNPPTASNPSTDVWNSNPVCTLRFAEVLAKVFASEFRISELLYLFNADATQTCGSPFPSQETEEVLIYPLDVPDDDEQHSLWQLRKELLRVEIDEVEWRCLSWTHIVNEFRAHFNYAPAAGQDPLLSLGQHFFPCALEASGYVVSPRQRQYRTPLTSTTAWNSPLGSPFQYDASSSELWVQLPLDDAAVAAKLAQLSALNPAEQVAVQDLYFAPRLDLALVAFLCPDWQSIEIHLIQEEDEHKRWHWFQRHFALANARRKVIAAHLARHVAQRTGCHSEDLQAVAALVLSHLYSDENSGTPWEADTGELPSLFWGPQPNGGAISALLGLVGTGLLGEYQIPNPTTVAAGTPEQVLWREVRGPMSAFAHERDATNSPIPTVLPALSLLDATHPLVSVTNGYAVKLSDGQRLGGAAAILVKWSGVLLIEHEGEYCFHAGAPTPDCEKPDFERAEKSQWRVTLQRGTKIFAVLNHAWPGNTEPEIHEPCLRRGAYQIVIEYSQPAPDYAAGTPHKQHTGFQVKYAGPDTEDRLIALPVQRLYRDFQDQPLDQGISFLPDSKNARAFLHSYATSTLRTMRRTYQRAFKAVLLAGKLQLSAQRTEHLQSELGYLLANPVNFAGYAYYRTSPTSFNPHLANFDYNFLPLYDNYQPPLADSRAAPSLQRTQALFDSWERLFDYGIVRQLTQEHCPHVLWQLFAEAALNPPTDPGQLLRYIGAEPNYWALDLLYYQNQSTASYAVSDVDLQDDRWLVRVWHAERWLRRLRERFHAKHLSKARPDLWAAEDPSAPVPIAASTSSGNANLLTFITDACFEQQPHRYTDLKRLNDGLRERGRQALLAYLCQQNRVLLPTTTPSYATKPADLSELLLLDVETGVCEKASRIEEAISAVQTFIRRSRLGLEPTWKVSPAFIQLWDSRYHTYRTWERSKLRELYRENWIEWTEKGKARRSEAFRFLEAELRNTTLTLAAPGGLDWWEDDAKSLEHKPKLIQEKVPAELQALANKPEGFTTLGSPEFAARPSWLAALSQTNPASDGNAGTPGAGTSRAVPALAKAAALGSSTAVTVPLWMEAASKLGKHFLRIAAAGVPQASRRFKAQSAEPVSSYCHTCGCEHAVLVDEYYFWLEDTQYYSYTDQTDASDPQSNSAASFTGSYQFGFQDAYYDPFQQQSGEWHEENQVPSLLAKWQAQPAVRLAWCRVHNGHFSQPRQSDAYVAISNPAELVFLGRGADSLYFQVTNSAPLPPGYSADPSPAGFRYDLAADQAIGTPQALKPPAVATLPYPGGLFSYPFFAYHAAGARLFPNAWFSPALTVAETLRAHCGFELALNWYQRVFDPLNNDCTWMVFTSDSAVGQTTSNPGTVTGVVVGVAGNPDVQPAAVAAAPADTAPPPNQGGNNSQCCDTTNISDASARQRAVLLHYCQTLLDWGDALLHRRSPEAFQQARLIYATVAKITGNTPQTILLPEPETPLSVTDFTPANPPLNPRLLDLYSLVADRLALIHTCQNSSRLHNGQANCDMPYWGDNPIRAGWHSVNDTCSAESDWCQRSSPYRFTFQIQKAYELIGRVRELGGALLAAYEKGDAEALASIRAVQERDMLTLGISIRQDQWRDADWQVQALQQTKELNQTNLLYFTTLYQNDLINDEIMNIDLTVSAMLTRTGANMVSSVGELFHILPDANVGALSTFVTLPTGKKIAYMFDTIAKIVQTLADIQSTTAGLNLTQAGWQRRSVEWFHQMQTLPIEIHQIELQILGAQRRRDQAMQELNNQQRQIENATEVLNFLRDKFTATDLYLFLQKETAQLYRKLYVMAHFAVEEAQRAYNFERGHTTRQFIAAELWDNLREGLMAGERLDFTARHMEKAYLDENVREYELTKHFSLRYHFPLEFLRLKETGRCEIKLPEWMFDLDYPGQYMRRIKNVTLTIPCVASPYNGVHCRATLLSSVTRIDPRLNLPETQCCGDCGADHAYEACAHDQRLVHAYAAREAIATSSGQNDAGLFELNFRDERYLPFEFQGAVSHWRIELPPENNYFDMDTLSDLLIHLNYTAREGGSLLREAAMVAARKHLPGAGWSYFDVRHEFPDSWQLLKNSSQENGCHARLKLRMERKMFPFIPGADAVSISHIALLFKARGLTDNDQHSDDCYTHVGKYPDSHRLEFSCSDVHREGEHPAQVSCIRSEDWPDLYYGVVETKIGPLGKNGKRAEIEFRFPSNMGEIETCFLLCEYKRE